MQPARVVRRRREPNRVKSPLLAGEDGKSEYRIRIRPPLTDVSKFETNFNDKNSKPETFWSFGYLDFDIVSCFGFRILNFGIGQSRFRRDNPRLLSVLLISFRLVTPKFLQPSSSASVLRVKSPIVRILSRWRHFRERTDSWRSSTSLFIIPSSSVSTGLWSGVSACSMLPRLQSHTEVQSFWFEDGLDFSQRGFTKVFVG